MTLSGTPQVNVWLLGTFRAAVGTRVIHDSAWRLRRARNLIKLLALAPGHRLHKEQVTEVLWPDLDPGRATNSLHQVLHFCRRTLQPDLPPRIVPDYLSLADDVITLCAARRPWVDCDAFAAAAAQARQTRDPVAYREALDLYAGALLPSDLYEDWVAARREELQQLHQALMWELASLYQGRGDLISAQATLEKLVAADPLQEEAHAALMRVYARSGRVPQALRQYDRLREMLERELGTQPAEDSHRLYQEILAGRYAQKTALDEPAKVAAGATAVRKRVHHARRAVAPRPLSNLPAPLTSFVGREREKAEVKQLLSSARLITLTGTGGAGKTRLALEVAREMLPDFQDGTWRVELASLSDGALVAHTLASALNVSEQPGRPVLATVTDSLAQKHLLLVLDNCEHLVNAVALLVGAVLQACPRVHILATSREGLKVPGESIWRVPSLSVPDPQYLGASATLNEFEAIRLFVERGTAVSSEFALTKHNAQDIGRIYWQLDGLPLPIELAASRLSALSSRQIVDRLADRFRLLKTDSALVSPRHQTLQAVMDWSYDLVSEEERRLFRRLSVFAGAFTLEAAAAVYDRRADEFDLIDLLTRLVDKSLILPEDHEGEVRYRLLETVRQYGQDKLSAAGEAEEVRRLHLDYFLALAEEAEPALTGGEQKRWLDRLEMEHDNLRAALDWSLETGNAKAALRMAGALWRFWGGRGHPTEGRSFLKRALEQSLESQDVTRAKALHAAGNLAWDQGDYKEARLLLGESLEVSRALGDRPGIAAALNNLGNVVKRQGDYAAARALFEESLQLSRAMEHDLGIARALNNVGTVAYELGDYSEARAVYQESLALCRRLGHVVGVAITLNNLANIARYEGDPETARALYHEGLAVARDVGHKSIVAGTLRNLGELSEEKGILGRLSHSLSKRAT